MSETYTYQTPEGANGFNIARDCTLVKVSGSVYSWSKKDRTAADNAARADNADSSAYKTYVELIPTEERLRPQQIIAAARDRIAFPKEIKWDNDGRSAVHNTRLEATLEDLNQLKVQFHEAVDAICANLPKLEADARARGVPLDRLGFPSEQELRDRYKFEIEVGAAIDPNDIRLNHVSEKAAEQIVLSVRKQADDKINNLHKQVVASLEAALGRVVSNLTEFSDGKIKRFEDSLITNLAELVECLPRLNVSNDRAVEHTIIRSRGLLDGLHKALAENTLRDKEEAGPEVRKKIATEASDILSKLKSGAVSAKV
jgi:hypothetical protein